MQKFGIFFFLFILGIIPWESMGVLWPIFPLIVGLAFIPAWLAGGDKGLIVPAIIGVAIGGLGFVSTSLGLNLPIGQLWPVFMILGGLGILAPSIWRSKVE